MEKTDQLQLATGLTSDSVCLQVPPDFAGTCRKLPHTSLAFQLISTRRISFSARLLPIALNLGNRPCLLLSNVAHNLFTNKFSPMSAVRLSLSM